MCNRNIGYGGPGFSRTWYPHSIPISQKEKIPASIIQPQAPFVAGPASSGFGWLPGPSFLSPVSLSRPAGAFDHADSALRKSSYVLCGDSVRESTKRILGLFEKTFQPGSLRFSGAPCGSCSGVEGHLTNTAVSQLCQRSRSAWKCKAAPGVGTWIGLAWLARGQGGQCRRPAAPESRPLC